MVMDAGIEHAWELLAGLDPDDVCRRARARFDPDASRYQLDCLGQTLSLSLPDRELATDSQVGTLLLTRLRYFSELAALRYLIDARDVELSGELVRPEKTVGGQIYHKGSHVLPLDGVAATMDVTAFAARGEALGGEPVQYADVAMRLYPFPRVPITILLWAGDDEFEARADLLLDSTCNRQLPPDALWSASMMTVLAMLSA